MRFITMSDLRQTAGSVGREAALWGAASLLALSVTTEYPARNEDPDATMYSGTFPRRQMAGSTR